MKGKVGAVLLACWFATTGCSKEESANPSVNDYDTLLFGLWQCELVLQTEYDSLNNVTNVDTVTFTDAMGDPVTVYEEYKSPSEMRLLVDLTDTLESCTFHKNGNNLVLEIPDSIYFFNNRTISILNDSVLSVFEYVSMNPKMRWTQTFRRW